ncbi:hypothetical protein [Bosea sp. TND4EK4]|uniref:hypothetical protein n=1 Tax=Bosea sp. TND4EK4 TaxID=1907408 RepID=UPI000953DCDE|nr:hypothetical protein [Bosea sp. TND4EK4]SIR47625.1 hypothetical protein SAMN05880592_12345 [Bosea sp. TND4EK4]
MSARNGTLAAAALAFAATFGSAQAACVSPSPASPAAIEAFKANPQAFLARFPEAGGALVSEVRNLATSDASVIAALAGMSRGSTPGQAGSIGTGLAQAAAICASREPQTAQLIQTSALGTDSASLILAFQAAAGDVRTTAVGAGAGGAAGGGGSLGGAGLGQGGGSSGGGGGFTRTSDSSTVAGSAFSFSTGSGIAPTLTTRRAVTSVSP